MALLDTLNQQQKAIVEYNNGPHVVIAGPGTGKTRVVTYKLAYLLEQGVDPESIFCTTFTNKAATELKEKVRALLGNSNLEFPWVGTFHSVFAKILRIEAKAIGYSTSFSIYDTEDSESLVTNIINDFNISSDALNPRDVTRRISFLKNSMIFPEDLLKKEDRSSVEEKFLKIYQEYQRKIVANDAMDFEDLVLKTLELLQNNKKAFNKYKKKFDYFLFDEFQETSVAQYEIIKLLCSKAGKICAIGDDSQSIYSWRGARYTNIHSFKEDFSRVRQFPLDKNFRSSASILAAASEIISRNESFVEKKLVTDNE